MIEEEIRQMSQQAWQLLQRGEIEQAVTLAWEACNRANFGAGNPFLYADCLNGLATMLRMLRQFTEAERCYQELLNVQTLICGRAHPDVANTLSDGHEEEIPGGILLLGCFHLSGGSRSAEVRYRIEIVSTQRQQRLVLTDWRATGAIKGESASR